MHSERANMAMAGMATVNSGAHPPDLTSGLCRAGTARQTACPRITRLQRPNPTANQKGKNPPSGPLIPQPMFSASDSQATSPASPNKHSAHTISAWRISPSFASPQLRLLLHGRNSLPLRQVQPLCIKEPQRPQPPGLPVPHRLVGIVDRGVHMLADQVDGHIATTLEGDVNEFCPRCLLELNSDDLVLLRCTCPPHLKLAGIVLDGL